MTICSRCVMDDTATLITYDNNGVCKYCKNFEAKLSKGGFLNENALSPDIDKFKFEVQNSSLQYDCIVGVSGGIDSSFALVKAVELGLRPLAVHMDNGWNTELAQSNIENLVKKLNVDLYTHVIRWSEYRFLMQAFFDADVLDVELLYDNAMRAVNYKMAEKYGTKFILSGVNSSTEGIGIPEGWNWIKTDATNIRALARRSDKHYKFVSFPNISTLETLKFQLQGYKWVPFLDYFSYKKEEAKTMLIRDFDYKPYPYKHYENIFTRFYQGYILPKKFRVDKRKAHLSSLIITNQISRDQAIEDLKNDPYVSLEALEKDKKYFLKKMKWSEDDLQSYLSRQPIPHANYPNEKKYVILILALRKLRKILYRA